MGLSPMDIFNDIMVKHPDVRYFLGEDNYKDSDTIALRKGSPRVCLTYHGSKINEPVKVICQENHESFVRYLC